MRSHTQGNSDGERAGAAGAELEAATGAAVGASGAVDTTNSDLADIFGPGAVGTGYRNGFSPGEREALEQGSQIQQQLRRDLLADTPMQPRWAEAAQGAPGGQFGPTVNTVTPGFMQGVAGMGGQTGPRGNNALNLLGGLIGVQQQLGGISANTQNVVQPPTGGGRQAGENPGGGLGTVAATGAEKNTVAAAIEKAVTRARDNEQRLRMEFTRQEVLGEDKKDEFKEEALTQGVVIKTFAVAMTGSLAREENVGMVEKGQGGRQRSPVGDFPWSTGQQSKTVGDNGRSHGDGFASHASGSGDSGEVFARGEQDGEGGI